MKYRGYLNESYSGPAKGTFYTICDLLYDAESYAMECCSDDVIRTLSHLIM